MSKYSVCRSKLFLAFRISLLEMHGNVICSEIFHRDVPSVLIRLSYLVVFLNYILQAYISSGH